MSKDVNYHLSAEKRSCCVSASWNKFGMAMLVNSRPLSLSSDSDTYEAVGSPPTAGVSGR